MAPVLEGVVGVGGVLSRGAVVLEVLGAPPLRRLWAAQVVSEVGDWAARLALALLVFDRTGSPLATAAITTVGLLPWFGIGQYLATFADRYDHRTVMLVSNVARAAVFALLALVDLPVAAVLALAFVAGCGDPPFGAAQSAALPQLSGERYLPALTLFNATQQVSTLLGFAAGGLLIAASSPSNALLVNAATFAVAAVLLLGLPRTSARTAAADDDDDGDGAVGTVPLTAAALLRAGTRALVSDRMVLTAASVVTVSAFGGIAAESLLVPYAAQLGLSERGAGLLATVMPGAALAMALLLPTEGSARRLLRYVCFLTAGASLGSGVLFAVDGPLVLAVAALVLAGILDLVTVPAGSVIGSRLPPRSRATAFSILQGALQSVQALGALAAGALAAVTSVSFSLAVLSVPGVIAAVLGLALLRRAPDGGAAPEGGTGQDDDDARSGGAPRGVAAAAPGD